MIFLTLFYYTKIGLGMRLCKALTLPTTSDPAACRATRFTRFDHNPAYKQLMVKVRIRVGLVASLPKAWYTI